MAITQGVINAVPACETSLGSRRFHLALASIPDIALIRVLEVTYLMVVVFRYSCTSAMKLAVY